MDKYIKYANYHLRNKLYGECSHDGSIKVLYMAKCIQDVVDSVRSKMTNIYSAIDEIEDINVLADNDIVELVCDLAYEDLQNCLHYGRQIK